MARKMTLEEECDNPPLTDEQLARMRPAREVMPPEFFEAVKRAQGRAPSATQVSITLDADVHAALESRGQGWHTAINDLLRQALKIGTPAA